jgi:hypothetical protein
MRRLVRPLLVLLAIVFLIEAWLWSHLEPIVEWIVARIPLRAVKARIAGVVRTLPPAATLGVFIVPIVLLFPLKLLGLWLLAHKHWIAAGLILVFAKLLGLAVTAFVFEMTKPKLLKLAWFRWLYEHVLLWLAWAHRLVDPIKRRIRKLQRILGPKRAGRMLRLMWRIRRRMRAARGGAGLPVRTDAPRGARTAQSP